jgi:tetratricopeptide (TPR) repeat protein
MTARANQNPFTSFTAVTGIAGILFGIIVGYVMGAGQPFQGAPGAPVAAAQSAQPAAALADEGELQAYRNILATDPKNLKANVELANKLYDAARYVEAIPFYQQAFALDPKNVNVSTDLGTALFYAGRTEEALVQLDKSLAIDATHAQTLFNIGIVRRDGKSSGATARKM